MEQIYLKVPNINELKYTQMWLDDPETMSYNAGYDINLSGYNKNTGTIHKTEEEIIEWYKKWTNCEPDKFYAHIYVENIKEPIGEIYYYPNGNIHSMGILIQGKYRGKGYSYKALIELQKIAFEKNNISELSDMIPIDRIGATKIFQKAGFIYTDKERVEQVFNENSISKELLITKEMYLNNKKRRLIK